jgi:hypothetical protein
MRSILRAFHFYHGWSHAEAMEHVRAAARFGEGIFVSHLFTLLWTLDVAWWWLAAVTPVVPPGSAGAARVHEFCRLQRHRGLRDRPRAVGGACTSCSQPFCWVARYLPS